MGEREEEGGENDWLLSIYFSSLNANLVPECWKRELLPSRISPVNAVLCPAFTPLPVLRWVPPGAQEGQKLAASALGVASQLCLPLCIVIPGRRDSEWLHVDHTRIWHLHRGTYPCGCVVWQPTRHGRMAANRKGRGMHKAKWNDCGPVYSG